MAMQFLKRRYRALILFIVNTFLSGTHFFRAKRILLGSCTNITIAHNTKIVGPLVVGNCGIISIGENCWIGRDFMVFGDGKVTIGDNCDFGPCVSFITGSHKIGQSERRAGPGLSFEIEVQSGCWVGAKASLLGNITVGKGCVIGANALVTKSFDSDSLLLGNPARIYKRL